MALRSAAESPPSLAREEHEGLCATIVQAHVHDDAALAEIGFSRIEAPLRRMSLRGTTRYALVEAIREASRTWTAEVRSLPVDAEARSHARAAAAHVAKADALYWGIVLRWETMGIQEARRALSRLRVDANDAAQWARLGLYAAATRFDPTRDVLFSTYAKFWVRAWCYRKAQPEGTIVHVPAPAKTLAWRIRRLARLGPLPDAAALAEALSVRIDQVEDAMRVLGAQQPWVSLDAPSPEDEPSVHHARSVQEEADLVDEDSLPDPILQKRVRSLLGTLKPRERAVIEARFGIGVEEGASAALANLGDRYGLSRERIRQIERGAMEKLKGLATETFERE